MRIILLILIAVVFTVFVSGCTSQEQCPGGCNDWDGCTKDYCSPDTRHIVGSQEYYTDYTCKHEPITPCCGNKICEPGECETCRDCSAEQCAPKACPRSCDDQNFCTEDYCSELTNYECKHITIKPCCGNSICESQENFENCLADCPMPMIVSGITPKENIRSINSDGSFNVYGNDTSVRGLQTYQILPASFQQNIKFNMTVEDISFNLKCFEGSVPIFEDLLTVNWSPYYYEFDASDHKIKGLAVIECIQTLTCKRSGTKLDKAVSGDKAMITYTFHFWRTEDIVIDCVSEVESKKPYQKVSKSFKIRFMHSD
jgi:hypothetical protein